MTPNPERRAWHILLISFAAFLIFCAAGLYVAQWFLFRSTVPLSLELTAARGTVRVILPNTQEAIAVTSSRTELDQGVIIQTDPTSQALLTFSDPRSGEPIASVALFRESELTLSVATSPRFGFGNQPYRIRIDDSSGRYQVVVLPDTRQNMLFESAATPLIVTMNQAGTYVVESHDGRQRVSVYEGEVQLTDAQISQSATIHAYETLLWNALGDSVGILSGSRSLVTDSDFSESEQTAWESYSVGGPSAIIAFTTVDGRTAIALDRAQANWPDLTLGHGEAGITQAVETNVNQYSQIELRLTFFIAEQSLSTCGIAGSECPMMVRVVYVDTSGVVRTYIHGFYAAHNQGLSYPLLCDTCRTDHERISAGSWYTFSENLMTLVPADQRPAYIREIGVYASGHAFHVIISEVDLVATE